VAGAYTADALVAGTSGGFPLPALKRGGVLPVSIGSELNYFIGLNGAQTLDAAMVESAIMTPEEAYGVDSKIDDGVPATGVVLAVTAVDTADASGALGTSTNCVNSTPTPDLYDLSVTNINCQLQVQSGAF
jgi:hypothetical protein